MVQILFYYRYAWSVPIKDKTKYSILNAFKTILKQVDVYPKYILSDKESGVRSKIFNDFCKSKNIEVIHPKTSIHAPFVEVKLLNNI